MTRAFPNFDTDAVAESVPFSDPDKRDFLLSREEYGAMFRLALNDFQTKRGKTGFIKCCAPLYAFNGKAEMI